MGKVTDVERLERENRLKSAAGPDSNTCDCCTPVDAFTIPKNKDDVVTATKPKITIEQKELVVIGAGPHALTLILRLLEPEADLCSDKERHIKADFENRMRPYSQVHKHIQNLIRGPSAVYRKKNSKKKAINDPNPPPLSLDYVKANVMVVDGSLSNNTGAEEEQSTSL